MAVYRRALLELTATAADGGELTLPADAAAVFSSILANHDLDGARISLALLPPSETELSLAFEPSRSMPCILHIDSWSARWLRPTNRPSSNAGQH